MHTTEPDDLEEVVAQLREKRAVLVARLQRIDTALEALSAPVTTAGVPTPAPRGRRRSGPSVHERVVRLLDAEDRDWSVAEIIEAFERRGEPLEGSSVNNNVRSVLAKLAAIGVVERTEPGRYRMDAPKRPSENNNGSAVAEPSSFA